jgi:hypothetical protein
MPVGPLGNVASISEFSSKFVFPIEDEIRSKIPLWMKFYCYEYSNTAIGRASAYTRAVGGANIPLMSNEKAQILVPAPVNFQTSTNHNYAQEQTTGLNLFPNMAVELIDNITDEFKKTPIGQGLSEALNAAKDLYDQMERYSSSGGGFGAELPTDMSDTMYVGSGASRRFEVRMNLPCLTDRDSKAAGQIVRAFEALSLPTARSLFSLSTTKFFHPPLWVFGIGPADSMKFDPDWTGYPQISVLRTVTHKKTAFETNSLAAIGYQGVLKPVAYTLTLVFEELEPAVRVTNPFGPVSTKITNRSGALLTTGTTVVPVTITSS